MFPNMYRILKSLLYLLYAANPVLVSFAYQHCQHNPQPAKLLLLAALLELVTSITAIQGRRCQHRVLSTSRSTPSSSNAAGATAKAWSQTAVQSGVQWIIPGFCCFLSSNLSFYALQRLPLHTYALLYSLRVVTTAVLANLLLQQKPNRQCCWSLLLLFAAVCIGSQSATTGTHGRSSAAAAPTSRFTSTPPAGAAAPITSWQQQQHQHGVQLESTAATLLPGLAAVVAVAVLSSAASIHTEWMLSKPQKQAAGEPLQLLSRASISCWAVALNGLVYWQYSSSRGMGSGDVGAGTALLSPVPATATAAAAAAAAGGVPWGCAGGVRQWSASYSPAAGFGHDESSSSSTPSPGFLSDLGTAHWVLVCLLAVAGLLGGAAAKRCQGSLNTACTTSLAVLLTVSVSASPMLLQQQQQPQLLFYVACCFAAAALMQLQRQQQQREQGHEVATVGLLAAKQHQAALILPAVRKGAGTSSVLHIPNSIVISSMQWLLGASSVISTSKPISSSRGSSSNSDNNSGNGVRSRSSSSSTQGLKGGPGSLPGAGSPGASFPLGGQMADWPAIFPGIRAELICWVLGVLDGLVTAAVVLSVLLLLLTGTMPASSGTGSSSGYWQQRRLALPTPAAAAAAVLNTTDVPMPPELLSMPCSNGHWLQREGFCPVINCSLAFDCTVSDPACCAHLNFQMLAYLDHLLTSRGLSQHYVIVYGTLLGECIQCYMRNCTNI
jgi:hypothetical protein